MLLVLVALFSALSKYFLNPNNLLEIIRDAAVPGIIGVGVTYVIITAGIDLSTGAEMALVAMVMANIYRYTLIPIPIMILVGILVGLLCGLFNGIIVAKLHLPEFIGTLATMGIFRAITYIIAIKENGTITSQPMKAYSYAILGKGFGRIYFVTIAFIVVSVIGQIVLKNSTSSGSTSRVSAPTFTLSAPIPRLRNFPVSTSPGPASSPTSSSVSVPRWVPSLPQPVCSLQRPCWVTALNSTPLRRPSSAAYPWPAATAISSVLSSAPSSWRPWRTVSSSCR